MVDVRHEAVVIAEQREAVIAEGPDALTFLQGQLSQDIEALAPGQASWSLLLHPQGKISAWFRITRVDHERFVIDVDHGWADEVLTRLNRFKLRTNITIERAPWHSVTLIGPGVDDVAVDGVDHDMITSWAGVAVRDLFGPDLRSDTVGLPLADQAVVDALRIEAGVPKMGAELDESTIPAAAGIVEQSVSFTKGCYTGQELVARIDSRGNNVPKRLLSVVFDDGSVPLPGTELRVDDDVVGSVTSASHSLMLDAGVALAYVSRTVQAGAQIAAEVAGGTAVGEVRELALVRG